MTRKYHKNNVKSNTYDLCAIFQLKMSHLKVKSDLSLGQTGLN